MTCAPSVARVHSRHHTPQVTLNFITPFLFSSPMPKVTNMYGGGGVRPRGVPLLHLVLLVWGGSPPYVWLTPNICNPGFAITTLYAVAGDSVGSFGPPQQGGCLAAFLHPEPIPFGDPSNEGYCASTQFVQGRLWV
jgi:hypothetical protein